MIRENIRVINSTGLHTRPAAIFIKTLKKYDASVIVINNGKKIVIQGMMSILEAGIKGNANIEIICEGPDELVLMDEIKELFASGFGEKLK